ncbi:hypothetical protein M9H77_05217 [Catharanthus roseus]|uniref:Uncharacterized protein n=1 Tax=Catharanthus roseus TaxID=4058 RepID=A0ACC0CGA5_CATRO|nr:hypothetical protein M9H77_05217 [Catharanthus roseus]
MKKKRMEGRNMVEVLHQCNQQGYMCFWRNCEENNILSDIIVAHSVSILMMRTWPFVLIMDRTYKTNKYDMLLLEAVGMTPTRKTFTVTTAFMRNEKFLYFESGTMNRAESEHLLLKAWIATTQGDLDIVFLKIDSLIEGQITKIKTTLEYSRLKEKDNDKSNPIIILTYPENLCRHWVRTSHMLPCSYELLKLYQLYIPLKLEDIHIFWSHSK